MVSVLWKRMFIWGRDAREMLERPAYYFFFSREMVDRIHFPNLGVLSALAWSEPSAAWAKARLRLPLFSLTTVCIALFSTACVGTHCRLRMSNGSCWQQIYFYTSCTLSQIFNVSCETDEVLCMRRRKLTVSHTASKWLSWNSIQVGSLMTSTLATSCRECSVDWSVVWFEYAKDSTLWQKDPSYA